ncbi:hypothetical protein OHA72_04630 [Dactylosporangium sp. NBC_01737]|uniref:TRAFAC clade GTPase domain-containing protein n=1 Tax=Dactylosporangium sp. NBC_01737 TaxID=2975959 RepID=UPI002E0E4046|nr:hypothetical protein OHA72_04630 [Dactylosporangium sp. NBC_01737]
MSGAICDEILAFTTPGGDEVSWSVLGDPDDPDGRNDGGGFRFRTRYLAAGNGYQVLQRRLVGTGTPEERDVWERRLDGEICAALRVHRRFGDRDPQLLLPRVVGYKVDVDEPFILWQPPPGEPLTGLLGGLLNEDIDRVLVDVLTALARLDSVGVVHRAISPATVRWDRHHAYLDGFGSAALAGEPREPVGEAPWSSPEQRAGEGNTDPRDDLWSVGVLLGRIVSGSPAAVPRVANLGPRFGALLGDLLDQVAARRPTAVEALGRLSIASPVSRPLDHDDRLAAGRRRFDELRSGRTPGNGRGAAHATVPVQQEVRRKHFWSRPAAQAKVEEVYPPRRCYLCLADVQWTGTNLRLWVDGRYRPLELPADASEAKRESLLLHAFQRCPGGGTGDSTEHYLPAGYLRSGTPINIAVIGRSGAGKTHLLTGIVRDIDADALSNFDVLTRAVDMAGHDAFLEQHVTRLYDEGTMLPHTGAVADVEYTDGLVLTVNGRSRPLMFFDVAGETLQPRQQRTRAAQFLSAVDALLFVADPDNDTVDATFGAVVGRLAARQGADGKLDLPAAIVVTKSDLSRFEEPVDRWIRARSTARPPLDWDRVVEESRDAFAYLHGRGRTALVAPFSRFRDCTLHFASATGGRAAADGSFPRGARPQRCLEPLLALLHQLDVLPTDTTRRAE